LRVLYSELVVFDLIPAGIKFKHLQAELRLTASTNPKDTTLVVDESLFAELVLHILPIIFAWSD
jgi:hypothetical protein